MLSLVVNVTDHHSSTFLSQHFRVNCLNDIFDCKLFKVLQVLPRFLDASLTPLQSTAVVGFVFLLAIKSLTLVLIPFSHFLDCRNISSISMTANLSQPFVQGTCIVPEGKISFKGEKKKKNLSVSLCKEDRTYEAQVLRLAASATL